MSQVTYGNFDDFCSNPSRLFMKTFVEICGSSVVSPRNRLRESSERSFGVCRLSSQQNCLGSPQTNLSESADYRVSEIALGVLRTIFRSPQIIESVKSSSGVLGTVFGNPHTIESVKLSSGSFVTHPQSTGDCANLA